MLERREWLVQRILGEIVIIERPPELRERFPQVELANPAFQDAVGLFVGVCDDWTEALKDDDMVRVPTEGGGLGFDIDVIFLGLIEALGNAIDPLGNCRCEGSSIT
jgi:hypothetical protein